jgi:hypothetical protein
VGFVVDKVALRQFFSEYFGFPRQFSFHRLLHTHLSSRAGKIGHLVVDVPSGLSLTSPQETKQNDPVKVLIIPNNDVVYRIKRHLRVNLMVAYLERLNSYPVAARGDQS